MGFFEQHRDRVWVSRRDSFDLNVTVIGGRDGVVVIDTDATPALGRALLDDIERLDAGDVRAVVNTHAHFDHCYGNAAFRTAFPDVPIHAHQDAVDELATTAARLARGAEGDLGPLQAEILAVTPVLPDEWFSSVAVIDLGDRVVELVHPGPAHTAGDLVAVVREADVDVLVAGDLVESPYPQWGDDSFPLGWPGALDLVQGLVGPHTLVVPGHGPLADAGFVRDSHDLQAAVAQQIVDLAGAGVPQSEALARGVWPVPTEHLAAAVGRAWSQLPRASRGLPMA